MLRSFNVCITGAAGHIAYSLYNILCSTDVFCTNTSIHLRLLETDQKMNQLKILKLELSDCCYQKVQSISIFSQSQKYQALQDVDIVIFLGSAPRKPGMDRKQVFEENAQIFKDYGKSLNLYAKKTCKSLVVANPPNTNCLILSSNAPSIPSKNFTCLTRLDYNRLITQTSLLFNCKSNDIKNAIVWGNHSKNQFCDLNFIQVLGFSEEQIKQKIRITDSKLIERKIHERGGYIADKTGSGTYLSAAISIIDHLKDWFMGTPKISSMGIVLQKQIYNLPKGLCFSVPTLCYGDGQYKVIDDLELNQESKKRLNESLQELLKQKSMVEEFINKIE